MFIVSVLPYMFCRTFLPYFFAVLFPKVLFCRTFLKSTKYKVRT